MTIPSKIAQKLKITKVIIEFEDENGKHIRVFPRDFEPSIGPVQIKVVYMLAIDDQGGLSRYYGQISRGIIQAIHKDLDQWFFRTKIGFHT